MPRRVLVTGASGFAGRWLLELLADLEPEVQILAWRGSNAPNAEQTSATETDGRIAWYSVDIRSRLNVRAALAHARPDEVYHLAGSAHVARSWSDTTTPLEVNAVGTHLLLDELRLLKSTARIVVAGSATVYQPQLGALTEESPLAPSSPYALSKLGQEMVAIRAATHDALDVIVALSFNHIGPGQQPTYFSSAFARQLADVEHGASQPVMKVGNLDAKRDLTDVRDTVKAYHALMKRAQRGRTYNVCTGRVWAIREVLDLFLAECRVPVTVELDQSLLRPADNPVVLGSPIRIEEATGWRPLIPIARTVSDLLADARMRWKAV